MTQLSDKATDREIQNAAIIHGAVATWEGKLLQDYTKEELIEIVFKLGTMYNNELKIRSEQYERTI